MAIDPTRALDALNGLRRIFLEFSPGTQHPEALTLLSGHLRDFEAATGGTPGVRARTEVLRGWASIMFSHKPHTVLGGPAQVRLRVLQELSALAALCHGLRRTAAAEGTAAPDAAPTLPR